MLMAAVCFDVGQADGSFANGLSRMGDAERHEFALIFKQLATLVWKKANQMLIRDVEKRGMSRAAKQHYEIKAKAAQLSAFSIELYPLSDWAEEVRRYSQFKSWAEHSQAERIDLFDMIDNFDSKSASHLDAFIACRERFMRGLAVAQPEEHARALRRIEIEHAESRQATGPVQNTRRGATKQDTSPCFVATALYRSDTHPNVVALRLFRDQCLTQAAFGRAFIRFYYGGCGARTAQLLAALPILRPPLLLLMWPLNSLVRRFVGERKSAAASMDVPQF